MTPHDDLARDLRDWMAARPVTPDDAVLLDEVLERTARLPQHRRGHPAAGWTRGPRIIGGRSRMLVPAATLTLIAVAALGAGGFLLGGTASPSPSPAPVATPSPEASAPAPTRYLPAEIPEGIETGSVDTPIGPARWVHLRGDASILPGPLQPLPGPDGLLWFDGGGHGPAPCEPAGASPSRTYPEGPGSDSCIVRPQLWTSADAISVHTELTLPVVAGFADLSPADEGFLLITNGPPSVWRTTDLRSWDPVDLSGITPPGPASLDWDEMQLRWAATSGGTTVIDAAWRALDAGRLVGRPDLGPGVRIEPRGGDAYMAYETTEGGDVELGIVHITEADGGLRFSSADGEPIAELPGATMGLAEEWSHEYGLTTRRLLVIDAAGVSVEPMPAPGLLADVDVGSSALLGTDERFRFLQVQPDGTVRSWDSPDGRTWSPGPTSDLGVPGDEVLLRANSVIGRPPMVRARGSAFEETPTATLDGATWGPMRVASPLSMGEVLVDMDANRVRVTADGETWQDAPELARVITKWTTNGGGYHGARVVGDALFVYIVETEGTQFADLWVIEFGTAPAPDGA